MIREALNRAIGTLIVVLLAALLVLAGLGFLGAALYLALVAILPAPAAAAICGVVAIAIALAMLLILRDRPAGKSAPSTADRGASPETTAADLAANLPRLIKQRAWAAVGGAFAIGLVFGVSPRVRRAAGRLAERLLDQA